MFPIFLRHETWIFFCLYDSGPYSATSGQGHEDEDVDGDRAATENAAANDGADALGDGAAAAVDGPEDAVLTEACPFFGDFPS